MGRDKGGAHRFIRRAAVLQPARSCGSIPAARPTLEKQNAAFHFHLVFRLVRPVPAPASPSWQCCTGGQGVFARQFFHIVHDAVLVYEFAAAQIGRALSRRRKTNLQAGIDNSLPFQHLSRKYSMGMWMSVNTSRSGFQRMGGARLPLSGSRISVVLPFCHVLPLFKMQGVLRSRPGGRSTSIYSEAYWVAQAPRPFRPRENS